MATKASVRTATTLDDYMALREPDGPRHELSEGDLLTMASPTMLHNDLRDLIQGKLRTLSAARGSFRVITETDFLLGPATVRRPDIAVLLTANFRPEYLRQVPIPVPPDVAIEIVSPNDSGAEMLTKVRQFLNAGTRSVWLFYPDQGEAHRFHAGAAAPEVFGPNDSWREPELLPGVGFELSEPLTCAC